MTNAVCCRAASLSVPVMRWKMIDIFGRSQNLLNVMRTPERLLIAFDIDNTMLRSDKTQPTTTFSNRPILFETARHLRRGTRIALITGNDIGEQRPRTVDPIIGYFSATKECRLLHNLYLFGMKGGNRISFDVDGNEATKADDDYNAARRIAENYIAKLGEAYAKILKQYPKYGLDAKLGPRPKSAPVQLAFKIAKEHADKRNEVAASFIYELGKIAPDVLSLFNIMPAGSTTVDIDQTAINKGTTLIYLMKMLGLTEYDPIIFMGDELKLMSDEYGRPISGNDLSSLMAQNVIAMAVNMDQASVVDHSRVIKAGSGPLATLSLLQYFSLVSETLRSVPPGTKIEFPQCRVPVLEKERIEIPQAVQDFNFLKGAVFLRINTLLADPVTGKYLDEKIRPSSESPVVTAIVELLMKDVKVVLMSGDSAEKQIKGVITKIFETLNRPKKEGEPVYDPSKISGLTLYGNRGATRVRFFADDKKLGLKKDNRYNDDRQIGDPDYANLIRIANQALEYYRTELKALMDKGDVEARGYYNEAVTSDQMIERRDFRAQISLAYLMPALREKVLLFVRACLGKEVLKGEYVANPGGSRSINLNNSLAGFKQAVKIHIKKNGLKQALCLGTEYFHRVSEATRENISGEDMALLELPEVIPIAFNQDQDEVRALNTRRIIPGGSGPEAAFEWLHYIANMIADEPSRKLRTP